MLSTDRKLTMANLIHIILVCVSVFARWIKSRNFQPIKFEIGLKRERWWQQRAQKLHCFFMNTKFILSGVFSSLFSRHTVLFFRVSSISNFVFTSWKPLNLTSAPPTLWNKKYSISSLYSKYKKLIHWNTITQWIIKFVTL